MIQLTIRNLKIFFRDKSSVFFSLLSVLIIIGLYVLFLGDMLVKNMTEIVNARFLMDSWIMAGVLGITSITTTMGAFGIMVDDKYRKISKDFFTAPVKKSTLAGGYILSTFVIGVIMCIISMILGEIYIVASGGEFLPFEAVLKSFGLILLSVISSSSMVFFAVSFFKSQNAFTTASTVIGTLIGFLTGIYIPVGSLPASVQFFVKIFPVAHSASLFRQVFMEYPLSVAFLGAPAERINSFKYDLGVVFKFGPHTVSPFESIVVLILTALLFYGLAIINMSRKKK
jgi:multidrug/hemolysin transport system permease protein